MMDRTYCNCKLNINTSPHDKQSIALVCREWFPWVDSGHPRVPSNRRVHEPPGLKPERRWRAGFVVTLLRCPVPTQYQLITYSLWLKVASSCTCR